MAYGNPYFTQKMYDAQQRNAQRYAAERTARASETTSEHIERLLVAMDEQLEIARDARASADRAQRFSKWVSIASLAVAGVSLAAAIAAVVVAL